MIVYRIINKRNGKSYVGMTARSLEQRWSAHLSAVRQGSKFRFHAAIRKYGVDAWEAQVEKEFEDDRECRLYEEQLIATGSLTSSRYGYNAKPGGCGGWIVPLEKFEDWKTKQSSRSKGANNANALDVTNEELISIVSDFVEEYGYVPGKPKMIKYASTKGVLFPKHFTAYRFGGFSNFVLEICRITGATYQPYHRDEITRERLGQMNKGRSWYHNDSLQKSKLLLPDKAGLGWIKGRKKYD